MNDQYKMPKMNINNDSKMNTIMILFDNIIKLYVNSFFVFINSFLLTLRTSK